jgi:muramoyltetrapeptide carboxypeptidase LdcA involved in peptidoglycan recycling
MKLIPGKLYQVYERERDNNSFFYGYSDTTFSKIASIPNFSVMMFVGIAKGKYDNLLHFLYRSQNVYLIKDSKAVTIERVMQCV